jgi:hypothetical protein
MTKTREDYFKQNFNVLDEVLAWHAVSVLGHPVWACQYCADTLEDEVIPEGIADDGSIAVQAVPNFTTIGEDPSDTENMSFEEFCKYGPFAVYTANYPSNESARVQYYAVSYALTAVDHAVFAGYGVKPSEAPTSRYKFTLNVVRDMLERELASMDTE